MSIKSAFSGKSRKDHLKDLQKKLKDGQELNFALTFEPDGKEDLPLLVMAKGAISRNGNLKKATYGTISRKDGAFNLHRLGGPEIKGGDQKTLRKALKTVGVKDTIEFGGDEKSDAPAATAPSSTPPGKVEKDYWPEEQTAPFRARWARMQPLVEQYAPQAMSTVPYQQLEKFKTDRYAITRAFVDTFMNMMLTELKKNPAFPGFDMQGAGGEYQSFVPGGEYQSIITDDNGDPIYAKTPSSAAGGSDTTTDHNYAKTPGDGGGEYQSIITDDNGDPIYAKTPSSTAGGPDTTTDHIYAKTPGDGKQEDSEDIDASNYGKAIDADSPEAHAERQDAKREASRLSGVWGMLELQIDKLQLNLTGVEQKLKGRVGTALSADPPAVDEAKKIVTYFASKIKDAEPALVRQEFDQKYRARLQTLIPAILSSRGVDANHPAYATIMNIESDFDAAIGASPPNVKEAKKVIAFLAAAEAKMSS